MLSHGCLKGSYQTIQTTIPIQEWDHHLISRNPYNLYQSPTPPSKKWKREINDRIVTKRLKKPATRLSRKKEAGGGTIARWTPSWQPASPWYQPLNWTLVQVPEKNEMFCCPGLDSFNRTQKGTIWYYNDYNESSFVTCVWHPLLHTSSNMQRMFDSKNTDAFVIKCGESLKSLKSGNLWVKHVKSS